MYEYQKDNKYFAQIAEGIKEAGSRELSELGAVNIRPAYGGLHFSAAHEALYRINYSTRLASRILAPLVSFYCSETDHLYEKAKQINWSDFISGESTFAVFGNVSNSAITHSHFASLRLKDAIVDSVRAITGERPSVDVRNPDIWLNLHIRENMAVISLDTSGGSLHRRGYRKDSLSAPMQETVAAAIIKYTGWNGDVPLYDPMCGSGTLLCEAHMAYCNIPCGIFRAHFGFEHLPDYDSSLWADVKTDCDRRIRALPDGWIAGSDISAEAVRAAESNIQNLPQGEKIKLRVLDFRNITGLSRGIIVVNPPYGIRMGNRKKLDVLYKSLGDFLKQKCKGSTAYLYFGERDFIKKIGLRPTWKKPLSTGGLEGRLVKYELF